MILKPVPINTKLLKASSYELDLQNAIQLSSIFLTRSSMKLD